MDHLDYLKKIIFTKLLKTFGQFVHVDGFPVATFLLLLSASGAHLTGTLLAGGICSIGGGFAGNGTRVAESLKQIALGILESDDLFGFVAGIGEVKIVDDVVRLAAEIL